MMKEFYNARYSEKELAYGSEPNVFYAEQLSKLSPGTILLPADGQGRNGVFAALQGWDVTAFDMSEVAKQRADEFAKEKGVSIEYRIGHIPELELPKEHFDVVALVFAHFPEAQRRDWHRWMIQFLKPGGTLILEGFSKNHIKYNSVNPGVGGPRDVSMLFSIDELKEDFEGFEIVLAEETKDHLSEGIYHIGEGALARLVARKL